uniref:Uncharacterized protein n=1 Tax=Clytia hemisphaerica TaxID=252671 RepID=A0A7M5X1N1_9CNID
MRTMAEKQDKKIAPLTEGSRFVHAYYVFPESTDESRYDIRRFQQTLPADSHVDAIGFERNPNEFLWQKRTFILAENEDGLRTHPEWMRSPYTIEQDVLSPSRVTIRKDVPKDDIDPSCILDDGSITEITQFTDLMCKKNIVTEVYVVSKTFPDKGYSITQNFRKMQHDKTGIETYIRGECIQYTITDTKEVQKTKKSDMSMEETLASFHLQRKLTSRILFLSKSLRKRGDILFTSSRNSKENQSADFLEMKSIGVKRPANDLQRQFLNENKDDSKRKVTSVFGMNLDEDDFEIHSFTVPFDRNDFLFTGKQRREKYTTQSLDRALFSKRRKVTSATGVDLYQSEQDSSKQNTLPKHNLIFHGAVISSSGDDNDSDICEEFVNETRREFQIQEDSRRIYTPTSMLENNENDTTTKSLPGIVRIDMEDSLRSSLQRQSSLQFVSEEDIEPTESSLDNQSPQNMEFAQNIRTKEETIQNYSYQSSQQTKSLDRGLFSEKRKFKSTTRVDLQQFEQEYQVTGEQQNKTFPQHNLIFHCYTVSSDDNDSDICEELFNETKKEFRIQEDSRRIYTPTSMLENNENVITIRNLPGIVRIDMEDSLRSSLQRQSSVQFVSEEDIESTESSMDNQSPQNFDFPQKRYEQDSRITTEKINLKGDHFE